MEYKIKDYTPLTIPKSIEFEKVKDNLFTLKINGDKVTVVSEYLCGTVSEPKPIHLTKDACECVKEELLAQDEPYPCVIKNFTYNGFMGKLSGGLANYRASFINWSGDPGISRMTCSDGKVRLIPTFALKGCGFSLPYDDTIKKKMFGAPSTS